MPLDDTSPPNITIPDNGGRPASVWGLALVSLLIFGGFLAWISLQQYNETIAQEYRYLESHARFGESQIAGSLRIINSLLEQVIDQRLSPAPLESEKQVAQQLNLLKEFPEVRVLVILNSDGRVASAASIVDPETAARVSRLSSEQRDFFTAHRDARPEAYEHSFMSRPFESVNGLNLITISRGIRNKDGRFMGVALASLSPKYFESVLRETKPKDPSSAAILVNQFGDVIFGVKDSSTYSNTNVAATAPFQAFLKSKNQFTHYVGIAPLDNAKRMFVVSKIGTTPLGLSVSSQYDVVLAGWRQTILVRLLSFLVTAVAVLTLAREIRRRIQERSHFEVRFREAMDATSDGIWEWNLTNDSGYFSPSYYRMLGYEPNEFPMTGQAWAQLIHPDDEQRARSANQDCIENRCQHFEVEYRLKAKDGTWKWILGRGKALLRGANGHAVQMIGTHVDITERKQIEQAVFDERRKLKEMTVAIPGVVYQLAIKPNREWNFEFLSQGIAELCELSPEHVYANPKALLDIVLPDDRAAYQASIEISSESLSMWNHEYRIQTPGGKIRWVRGQAVPQKRADGTVLWNGILSDISELKALEEKLQNLARTDSLTGLSNRRHFMEQGEIEISRALRHETPLSVLMVDVDHFKSINDSHGHKAGDKVLQAFASTCLHLLRDEDMVGRIGGEEFGIILPEADQDRAFDVAERIRKTIEATAVMLDGGVVLRMTVSVGISTRKPEELHFDVLLGQADEALYMAKRAGRNMTCMAGQQLGKSSADM